MFLSTRMMMGRSSSGGATLDTQTVTTGVLGTAPTRTRGFVTGSTGSISDGTSNVYAGAAIRELDHDEGSGMVTWQVTGLVANSGWTNMVVDGSTTFVRASATYTQTGGNTYWQWASGNVFGGSGSTHTITWT